jgi:uncharacterized protein
MRGSTTVDGVLQTQVVRDGFGATDAIVRMLSEGRLGGQAQVVLTDGIAVGGFNVIDLPRVAATLGVPVVAVMRRAPKIAAVRSAILKTSHAQRRWRLVQAAGPIHLADGLWFQVAGAGPELARRILRLACGDRAYPEALRLAHLIAGAIATGCSRGRP